MDTEPKPSVMSFGREIDRGSVVGDEQNIIDIFGRGSGRGFELRNVNLPIGWQSADIILEEKGLKKFEDYCRWVCLKWGYQLNSIVLDPSGVIRELEIMKSETQKISKMYLSDDWVGHKEGTYLHQNVNTIETTMVFQEIMSRYFTLCWGREFDYGYIYSDPSHGINGYSPSDLKIPETIFCSGEHLVSGQEQVEIRNRAHNLAGRFGQDLNSIDFNELGIMRKVSLARKSAIDGGVYYHLPNEDGLVNTYESDGVDNPYQAAALHGITAMYINFLLKQKRNKS